MSCRPIPPVFCTGLALASLMSLSPAAVEPKLPNRMEQPFHISYWTSEHGLPQNRVSALAQTGDGYLWAGTWFGLARFDGVRFVVFNSANTPELKKEAVTALAVDRTDDALWIGTREGLLRLKHGRFTRPADKDGMSEWKVWRLTAAAGGGVWVDAGEQVVFYRDGASVVATLQFLKNEHVQAEWETEDGRLTLATTDRLLLLAKDGTVGDWTLPAGAPKNQRVAGLFKDRESGVWLSLQRRLLRYGDGQWEELQELLGVQYNYDPSDHFLEDRAGGVWVARGQAGLWRYSQAGEQQIELGESGGEKRVSCMLEDNEGQVWVGAEQGLFQLRPRLIRAFTAAHGLPHDNCWSVCEGPDRAIYVETDRGVTRIQDERVRELRDEPGRFCWRNVLVDLTGAVWLGNGHEGLIVWQPGAETNRFWEGEPITTVVSLYLDHDGRVWVGTDRGVTWFEGGQPAARWGEFGLPTNGVRSIYQTRDGTMWFGTGQAGVVRWSGVTNSEIRNSKSEMNQRVLTSTVTRFTTADGLADDRVFVFHEDTEGALWIGTHNGLSRLQFPQPATVNSQPQFFTFRTEHGLLHNLINWLEEDDFGRMWFSCNRGIFRIDRRELNAVASGQKARARVAVYGVADGMPSPETNGEHQPAGCKASDGRLWFPTTQGVVVIDPRAIKDGQDSEGSPPVVIEEVVADGEVIYANVAAASSYHDGPRAAEKPPSEPVVEPAVAREGLVPGTRLPPGRARTLQIRYTSNSFTDPRRVRFRYRLGGSDRDWREQTAERVAYFADLRPGNYTFAVMAAGPQGIWNETPATFAFSLAPHFWQTWPFYALCAGAVIGLVAGMQTYRLRWQRRLLKVEEQRTIANERTRIARDLHDDLGTALTGLALELDVIGRGSKDASESERLGGTARRTRELAERMREVVWTVNPACDTVSSVASFLEQQVSQFLRMDGIQVRLEFPEDIPALPLGAEARHQLALSVREALTNIARHAKATEVFMSLAIEGQALIVRVKDNGCGFRPVIESSHGLGNMRARLEQIGGSFECASAPGAGTEICLRVPTQTAASSKRGDL